ncbi:hypothetical protein FXO38_25866 [Capsicum annuum]|nr:hypothetical protein FXO37_33103 [Capsicum annuum]KAF3632933.1 hypothetical protein FXO38_25866 [Capsicum annuum]
MGFIPDCYFLYSYVIPNFVVYLPISQDSLYNFLISTYGKCKNSKQAVRYLLEEINRFEFIKVNPIGQTFICLLKAIASAGQINRVYAIVRGMIVVGLGLNKFFYVGFKTTHKNKEPVTNNVASKIMELVEQSKGWSAIESPNNIPLRSIIGMTEEELYNGKMIIWGCSFEVFME